MDRPVLMRELRREIRRDKQANRLNIRLSPELTREFKRNQRPQAVTKEGKRLVQHGNQGLGKGLDKRRKLSERRLPQASSPTRELNRADLNIRWQALRPGAKNRGTGSCVREAEQTKAGLWVQLSAGNPVVRGGFASH